MRSRSTITFSIRSPFSPPDRPLWLGKDPNKETWTADENLALRVTMHAKANTAERARIEHGLADVLGGFDRVRDMQRTIDTARATVYAEITASLWPEGRPNVDDLSDKQRHEMDEMFDAAWRTHGGAARDALEQALHLQESASIAATWEALIVNPTTGWATISDMELSETAIDAIIGARRTALREHDLGNVPASA